MQLIEDTAFGQYLEYYDLKVEIDQAVQLNINVQTLANETIDRLTLATLDQLFKAYREIRAVNKARNYYLQISEQRHAV